MKKQLVIICLCLFTSPYLNAQTNTFPTSGNVGIGTTSPNTTLTIEGASSTQYEGTDQATGGSHHLELVGTSSNKALLQGPTITFRSSANTDGGGGGWAMARLMGAPASLSTSNALGAFHIQVRDSYDPGVGGYWNWRTGLSMINNGNVGIGTTNPTFAKLQIRGGATHMLFAINRPNNDVPALYIGNDGSNNAAIAANNSDLTFGKDLSGSYTEYMRIKNGGNVGIGTSTPDSKLTVKGNIHTNEVKVDLLGAVAPDYVFYKDYDLKTLHEVENYISKTGHLPNIPSAKNMEVNGIKLKEMNLKLLEKIEELTLYTINQEKDIKELKLLVKELLESKK